MPTFDHLADILLSHLLWTSLQAVVLVGVVALIVRLLPRLPASARCALWWLVGLQVVIGLCSQVPIRLPLLAPSAPVFTVRMEGPPRALHYLVKASATRQPATASGWKTFLTWRNALATLWLLGVLAPLAAIVRDRQRMRRWVRDANQPPDTFLWRRCEELSRRMGLRRCPQLRISSAVTSPLVTGLMRPVILWPAVQSLTPEETSLALAHELAHLKRGDLWLGCVPVLAQRLLFFHPLVRWALREYAVHREAACDARAMRALGADPRAYGQLLLRLGVSDLGPATLAGASATFRGLKRRLLMLEGVGAGVPRGLGWALVALIAVVGVSPYRVVAAAGRPVVLRFDASPVRDGAATASAGKCAAPVKADDVPFCGADYLLYTGPAEAGQGVVLFDRGSVVIAGDHADVVAAKRFYQPGTNLLWFRRDGKRYLTRDPAILRRANALVASASAWGRDQAGSTGGLSKLVAEQGKLVDRQGELTTRQGALVAEEGRLVALQAATSDPVRSRALAERVRAQQANAAALQPEIAALQTRIGALQQHVRTRQAELQTSQHVQSDGFRELAASLTKLATESLASGDAQEVER